MEVSDFKVRHHPRTVDLTRAIDERVKNRAIRNPWDYAVGTDEERTVWQEEADEAARQDGQFGAGA